MSMLMVEEPASAHPRHFTDVVDKEAIEGLSP
jgi:hypothetical protein